MIAGQPCWRDVGAVDAYWEAHMDLTGPQPELNLYDDAWPIRSMQHQLLPAKYVFDDDGRRGRAVGSVVASGCIVGGATVRRSLLSSKLRVSDGSLVEDSLSLPNGVTGLKVTVRRAIIDKQCVLPDRSQLGVDPADDCRRFTVTGQGVTLVTPGMLGQNLHSRR